ncbi:MAG: EamA family transporter [Proteobacteria bacterium]|nr:EamA family transporter [Pseudomonadota bacterium]
MNPTAILHAIAAAVFFGLSTPVAKLLVGTVDPWVLAGILYAGAGVGLLAFRLAGPKAGEARLVRADLPWLAMSVVAGGIAGPALLMLGLARLDGSTASLLLILEGVFTALLAWFAFRENFDRRIAVGMGAILAGAAVLSWPAAHLPDGIGGPLLVAGACLAWAIDNNVTRKVALADPVVTAAIKGLVAGPVNIALGLAAGATLPDLPTTILAALTGLFGYGISIVLFVLALRHLGTARTGAYFSLAPFIGALAAVVLLGEPVTSELFAAGALMAVGVWLHVSERHEHPHDHAEMAHAHRHTHDEHHRHDHPPGVNPAEPHTHAHVHSPLRHAHPHMPDSHHRHSH